MNLEFIPDLRLKFVADDGREFENLPLFADWPCT
jgi:hypothetical protein